MRRPAAPEARQNPRRQASDVATTHPSPDAKAGPVGPLRTQPEFRDEQVSLRLPCRRSARAAAYGAREPFCGNAFANASGAEVADGPRCDRRPEGGVAMEAIVSSDDAGADYSSVGSPRARARLRLGHGNRAAAPRGEVPSARDVSVGDDAAVCLRAGPRLVLDQGDTLGLRSSGPLGGRVGLLGGDELTHRRCRRGADRHRGHGAGDRVCLSGSWMRASRWSTRASAFVAEWP